MKIYTITYIFISLSVQPMARIDDPIADIKVTRVERVTISPDVVSRSKTLKFLTKKDERELVNEALSGKALCDIKVSESYVDVGDLVNKLMKED